MKDYTKEELEASRPKEDALESIDFCLQHLYADKAKATYDYCVDQLTYEELIGTLLLARDKILKGQ